MDCCNLPESPGIDANRCRQCGSQGRKVPPETMENLLKPEVLARRKDATYFFDLTPGCDDVYFSNEADSYFAKDELRVRVGIKETESPVPICYWTHRGVGAERDSRDGTLDHGGSHHRRGPGRGLRLRDQESVRNVLLGRGEPGNFENPERVGT